MAARVKSSLTIAYIIRMGNKIHYYGSLKWQSQSMEKKTSSGMVEFRQ